jgi:catechol 2,3-dioxygenase-like lactoylglutathione lyase family enzyme
MAQLPGIHHVQIAIPANSEDIARKFYGELLEFREIAKPINLQQRGGVWFETRNMPLHLGVDKGFRPARKAHVAFFVDDIDRMRARVEEAGYHPIDDEPLVGYIRFYLNDPFGNRLELLEPE